MPNTNTDMLKTFRGEGVTRGYPRGARRDDIMAAVAIEISLFLPVY